MNIVAQARAFAIGAHSAVGQVRRYTGEPYWRHPEAVAAIVHDTLHLDGATAAAWLHDVVEDTKVDLATIYAEFGPWVGTRVQELTDISKPEDGNRDTRKAIDRVHNAEACAVGQTIKVADLIDNTSSIVAHDPGFAAVYMREKRALLDVLTKADRKLLARAGELVQAYEIAQLERALR